MCNLHVITSVYTAEFEEDVPSEEEMDDSLEGSEHGRKAHDSAKSRHMSKTAQLARAMKGTGFTWRELKTVVVYYVKCLEVGYHPTPDDVRGFY